MTSTEQKITFEQMPQAVSEIRTEILGLKEIVRQALSGREEKTADRWMNLAELCEYHPDHPATVHEYSTFSFSYAAFPSIFKQFPNR